MSQSSDWEAKLTWMRAGGVDEAQWDNNGLLLRAKLGADPKALPAEKPPERDPVLDRRATLLAATSRISRPDGR